MTTDVVELEDADEAEAAGAEQPVFARQIEKTRQEWEAASARLSELRATLARYQTERAQLDAALNAATLESDAMDLAAKKIRRELLAKEISRLEREAFRAEREYESLDSRMSGYQSKLVMAWAIVNDLRTRGLRQRQLHGMEIGDLLRRVDRARETIRSAGEGEIGPITLEI